MYWHKKLNIALFQQMLIFSQLAIMYLFIKIIINLCETRASTKTVLVSFKHQNTHTLSPTYI